MRRSLALATLALFSPLTAQAACLTPERFYCEFSKDRMVEICAGTEMFSYTFGPEGEPDIELEAPYAQHPVTPWPGVSRNIWSSVRFENRGTTYEVWASVERGGDAPVAGGIDIAQKGKTIAQLQCLPGTVEGGVDFFEAAMTTNGYCYDYGAHGWKAQGHCG